MARCDLVDHPKFKRLARAVGSRIIASGLLEAVWHSAYTVADPYVGTAEDVADSCDWARLAHLIGQPDDPTVLVDLLKTCGFLDEPTPGHYVVHDLLDHAPGFVRAKWARRKNTNKIPPPDPPTKATSSVDTVSEHCDHTLLVPTVSDTNREREREREYKNSDVPSRCFHLVKSDPPPNPRVLAKAAHDELTGHTFDTETDLKEAVKDVAVQYDLPWTGESLTRTLDLLARSKRPLAASLPDHVPRRVLRERNGR